MDAYVGARNRNKPVKSPVAKKEKKTEKHHYLQVSRKLM